MAVNTTLSNAVAIAACDAIVDLIDGGAGAGKLAIYSGAQPANPDIAVGVQVKLAEITLNDPAFGAAVDGTGKATATADVAPALTDSSADATGTAAWFRVVDSNDLAVIDGSVGTATADLILNTVSIVSGAAVTISSWTFSMPETS